MTTEKQWVGDRRVDLLKEANRQLAELLADPHPGLFTWTSCMVRVVQQMNAIISGERDE